MGCGRSSAIPPNAVSVCRPAEFPERTARCVEAGGNRIAVFRVKRQYYALDDACAHRGASLSVGEIEDCGEGPCITCPWHGCRVVLATGARAGADPQSAKRGSCADKRGSGRVRQRRHRAFVAGGVVWVDPTPPPGAGAPSGAAGRRRSSASGAPCGPAESDRWRGSARNAAPRSPHSRAVDCRAMLVRRREASGNGLLCTFDLSVQPRLPPPLFRPGQYGCFELPPEAGGGFAGHPALRHYSLHHSDVADFAITVKQREGGRAATWFHRIFEEGASIRLLSLGGGFGIFNHRPPVPRVLMVAVGAGITPLYSQLRAVYGEQTQQTQPVAGVDSESGEYGSAAFPGLDVVLLYGERERADLAFTNDLDRWEADLRRALSPPAGASPHAGPTRRLAVHYTLTSPDDAWGGLVGRVSVPSIRDVCPDVAERAVQLCGPRDWREALIPRLVSQCGVPQGRITEEDFDL